MTSPAKLQRLKHKTFLAVSPALLSPGLTDGGRREITMEAVVGGLEVDDHGKIQTKEKEWNFTPRNFDPQKKV